jgi:type I restriction enzyme S subunit
MIPVTEWRETRLKNIFTTVRNGIWGNEPEGETAVFCVRGTDFDRTKNRVDPSKIPHRSVPANTLRDHQLRSGDLILEKSGGSTDQPVGSVALFDLQVQAVCSNFNARMRVSSSVDPRFACYLMNGLYWSGFTRKFIKQTTGIQNLDAEALLAQHCTLPPISEQRRIADFLDAETGRIDTLANGQHRALDVLEERIDSQILRIIGESRLVEPFGSPAIPLRRLITKLNRPTVRTDEVITAFRDGQVTSRSVRRSEGYTLTAGTEPQGQGVEVGDVVVHGLDGFAGAIGDSEASGNCSPVYHVCTPADGGNSAFYGRLLRVLAVDNYLGLFAISTRERAVDFRSWDLFGRIPVPHVAPLTQHNIGNLIVSIRPLRKEIARFNELLTERRQALITAAVTGQIDVTTARGVSTEGIAV